jgi:hypothetical protein
LENYAIVAADGDIGRFKDVYFDDEAWVVRYLVIDTGSWLSNRKVLISPISVVHPNWAEQRLSLSITKEQVKNSPSIDTEKPVSRQMEEQYYGYYGYPYYWGGEGMWGDNFYPDMMAPGYDVSGDERAAREREGNDYAEAARQRHRSDDPHLRSGEAVTGYHIHATDGEIGHVETLLVDEETWAIRYIVVNTSNWLVGHKVLVAPQWITGVRWVDRSFSVGLTRESVKKAPPYDSTAVLNRKLESALYHHHGRTRYWMVDTVIEPQL